MTKKFNIYRTTLNRINKGGLKISLSLGKDESRMLYKENPYI